MTDPTYGTPEDWRRERPAETNARLVAAGKRVAEEFASDNMSSGRHRPLAGFVAEALAVAERAGEQRADARYSALLDRVAATVRQRQDLAVEKDRRAEVAAQHGHFDLSNSLARWATELRGQVDAIRSVLDPAEQAKVASRIERLRRADYETRPQ